MSRAGAALTPPRRLPPARRAPRPGAPSTRTPEPIIQPRQIRYSRTFVSNLALSLGGLLLAAGAVLALPGCAKQNPEPTNTDIYTTQVIETAPVEQLEVVQPIVGAPVWIVDMEENFSKIYFQYDSAELSRFSREALRDNVDLMKEHPDVYIRVQGHADERGSTEYNLALGQERADAVKELMVASGVSPMRIDTVSYGEERPLDTHSNKAAWSKNRRAEFVITWSDGEDLSGSTASLD
ncbi:MAG: peptidoglycan-associated lipoprotein Pal [Alphaproteobacteria bacterium]|nr:peptidoglycan-associated lipoprotein Pal [Alphaproteobacteria bacterium]